MIDTLDIPRPHPEIIILRCEECGMYYPRSNRIRIGVGSVLSIPPEFRMKWVTEAEREDLAIKLLYHELEHYHDLMYVTSEAFEALVEPRTFEECKNNIIEKLAYEMSGMY